MLSFSQVGSYLGSKWVPPLPVSQCLCFVSHLILFGVVLFFFSDVQLYGRLICLATCQISRSHSGWISLCISHMFIAQLNSHIHHYWGYYCFCSCQQQFTYGTTLSRMWCTITSFQSIISFLSKCSVKYLPSFWC